MKLFILKLNKIYFLDTPFLDDPNAKRVLFNLNKNQTASMLLNYILLLIQFKLISSFNHFNSNWNLLIINNVD